MNLEEKIQLVKDIKKFAVRELGIVENSSFTEMRDTSYGLYASRKDRIESVIKTKWSYEYYEDNAEMEKRQKELEKKGFDVYTREIEALSEEGCPITKALLNSSLKRLVFAVLHENFHIHCKKKKIKLKPEVEEAVGICFGFQGAFLYFKENPQMRGVLKRDFRGYIDYYDFINKYLQKVKEVYKQGMEEGRKVFRQAKRARRGWLKGEKINHAFFVMMSYYAPKMKQVYEALKDTHPKDYTNKKILYSKLNSIGR